MIFFHRRKSLDEELDVILDKNKPGIYAITGMRGMGKTSTLHYIGNLILERYNDNIVIGIRVIENIGMDHTEKELGIHIIQDLLQNLIKYLYRYNNNFYLKYKKYFVNVIKELGMEEIEGNLLNINKKSNNYDLQKDFLLQTVELLHTEGISVTFLIDNLDKFMTDRNEKMLMEFLSGPFAQSFFESIVSYKGKIFLSISSRIYDYLSSGNPKWEGLNYLTSTLELKPLTDLEAHEVLRHRFKRVSSAVFPFDSSAIEFLNNRSNGILRTLLWNAKHALAYGAEKSLKKISKKDIERMLKAQDIYKINETLKNENSDYRAAIIWLLGVAGEVGEHQKEDFLDAIISLSNHILYNENISEDYIIKLTEYGIVEDSNIQNINEYFVYLVHILYENNVEVVDWFKWYLKSSFNFKDISGYEDFTIQKLKRLLEYIENHKFNDLEKYVNGTFKRQKGIEIKKYIIEDLKRIIDIYTELNLGGIEEKSDTELFEDLASMSYYFMRMINNMIYSETETEMDFHEYGSTLELFKNIFNNIFVIDFSMDKRVVELFEDIMYIRRQKSKIQKSETRIKLENAKKYISQITDITITILQKKTNHREEFTRQSADEITSTETISTMLRLSTGNWCHMWIEGKSPGEFSILLWEENNAYFTITFIKTNDENILRYRETLREAHHAEGIAKTVWMGRVALDSSILISKNEFKKLIEYGFLDHATIIIPPTVFADIKYTKSTKTKEKLSLAINDIKRTSKKYDLKVEEIKDIPNWMEEEIKKIHPSLISNQIDDLFITWCLKSNITAIIGDKRNVDGILSNMQFIWLLPGTEMVLTSWESIRELYGYMKKTLGNLSIRYSINEICGKPIGIGTIDLETWNTEIKLFY